MKAVFCSCLTPSEHTLSALTSCVLTLFNIPYLPRCILAIKQGCTFKLAMGMTSIMLTVSKLEHTMSLIGYIGVGKMQDANVSFQEFYKEKVRTSKSFNQFFLSKGITCKTNYLSIHLLFILIYLCIWMCVYVDILCMYIYIHIFLLFILFLHLLLYSVVRVSFIFFLSHGLFMELLLLKVVCSISHSAEHHLYLPHTPPSIVCLGTRKSH